MRGIGGFLFNTGHGVLACQLATSAMLFASAMLNVALGGLVIPERVCGVLIYAWLVSLVLVAVSVPVSLFRRRWDWAAMQLFGGLLLIVLLALGLLLALYWDHARDAQVGESAVGLQSRGMDGVCYTGAMKTNVLPVAVWRFAACAAPGPLLDGCHSVVSARSRG